MLQPNGVYICVSHGQPSYRLTYMQRPEFGWNAGAHSGSLTITGQTFPGCSMAKVKTYTVQKPMMGMTASLSADDKDLRNNKFCACSFFGGQRALHLCVCERRGALPSELPTPNHRNLSSDAGGKRCMTPWLAPTLANINQHGSCLFGDACLHTLISPC